MDQISSATKAHEAMRQLIKPSAERVESIQKCLASLTPMLEYVQKNMMAFHLLKFEQPEVTIATRHILDLQIAIQESLAPLILEIQEGMQSHPIRIKEALLVIAGRGWYCDLVDISLSEVAELANQIEAGGGDGADAVLIDYFERRLFKIEEDISTNYQHRSHITRPAFDAHHRGEYTLSIPALLAQADGICKEVIDQSLFRSQDRKPCTALYVSQLASDSCLAALLSPLTEALPISQTESQRSENFDALNRHMVLHGESLDYGTKINSLKAISLLSYVAEILAFDNRSQVNNPQDS